VTRDSYYFPVNYNFAAPRTPRRGSFPLKGGRRQKWRSPKQSGAQMPEAGLSALTY